MFVSKPVENVALVEHFYEHLFPANKWY